MNHWILYIREPKAPFTNTDALDLCHAYVIIPIGLCGV